MARKKVVVTLPGIKAVSRNQTTGHYIHYYKQLMQAEQWMIAYGKHSEHHFSNPVDVTIEATYDTRGNKKCADPANIDDKIFTDVLIRYKKRGRRTEAAIERSVWFIEDDAPKYLASITKRAIPGTEYKVVITIEETQV